ncbi:hypothetical protein SKAU_G00260110 [Synaphobranchus kaupii]|uniref:Uncharacterized protein n=1 Tax=Synaphobranchus kaupii TaxID=118154 RepID=A0A9Q1F4N5_SYNKA|nr:hypothetical protein SKAU_G00260110 [Synaphobranchus kaupii]
MDVENERVRHKKNVLAQDLDGEKTAYKRPRRTDVVPRTRSTGGRRARGALTLRLQGLVELRSRCVFVVEDARVEVNTYIPNEVQKQETWIVLLRSVSRVEKTYRSPFKILAGPQAVPC